MSEEQKNETEWADAKEETAELVSKEEKKKKKKKKESTWKFILKCLGRGLVCGFAVWGLICTIILFVS